MKKVTTSWKVYASFFMRGSVAIFFMPCRFILGSLSLSPAANTSSAARRGPSVTPTVLSVGPGEERASAAFCPASAVSARRVMAASLSSRLSDELPSDGQARLADGGWEKPPTASALAESMKTSCMTGDGLGFPRQSFEEEEHPKKIASSDDLHLSDLRLRLWPQKISR